MRKFSFLFVIGLMSAAMAVSAFAGETSECEFLKDKDNLYYPEFKGLYGLCVAYQNADEDGREDIIRLWDKRVAELDVPVDDLPEMPNRDDALTVACPCWDANDMVEASSSAFPDSCLDLGVSSVFPTAEFAIYYKTVEGLPAWQFEITDSYCFFVSPTTSNIVGASDLTTEGIDGCREDVRILKELDFADFVCDGS